MWEKEKMLIVSIQSFSHNVFYSKKREIIILKAFNLTSANVFNFIQSKILLFGKQLNSNVWLQI